MRSDGIKVTKYKVGDKVGVGCFVDSCRTCDNCNNDLNNYCLDENYFTIEGSYSESNIKVFNMELYLCQNTTENNDSCKSPKEIVDFFKGNFVSLMYTDSIMQNKIFENA